MRLLNENAYAFERELDEAWEYSNIPIDELRNLAHRSLVACFFPDGKTDETINHLRSELKNKLNTYK